MHIQDLIRRSPFPPDALAAELGVSPRTLAAYARQDAAPAPVRALLTILAGRVPWPEGRRLVYVRGALYRDSEPVGVPLAEIPAYAMRLAELDAVWRQLNALRQAPAQYLLDL